jgi:hypothetical protein
MLINVQENKYNLIGTGSFLHKVFFSLCTKITLCLLLISMQGVTKRCRLSWLTNSALVYEPKCGRWGGGAGSQPMSTVQLCTWSPNKLWRFNSIFYLCIHGKGSHLHLNETCTWWLTLGTVTTVCGVW